MPTGTIKRKLKLTAHTWKQLYTLMPVDEVRIEGPVRLRCGYWVYGYPTLRYNENTRYWEVFVVGTKVNQGAWSILEDMPHAVLHVKLLCEYVSE